MKIQLLIFFYFFAHLSFAQNNNINGYVKDKATGEALINASIYDSLTQRGVVTNEYGFFSLPIVANTIAILHCSYVGYGLFRQKVEVSKQTIRLDIELVSTELGEVKIVGAQSSQNSIQMSSTTLSLKELSKIPTLGGEIDILKGLTLLPGVSTTTEGSSNLMVRGGNTDQNLILLDGATVYNPTHLAGFFSIFNADALSDVALFKGGFPAQYGGRLSSVIDIKMKEGNNQKPHGSIGIGLITSHVFLESPIKKNTTSFMLSARASYLTLTTLGQLKEYQLGKRGTYSSYYLYDINAKVNHQINLKNKIFASFYKGKDISEVKDRLENKPNPSVFEHIENNNFVEWTNTTGTLRYTHEISSKCFLKTMLLNTQYSYNLGEENNVTNLLANNSPIKKTSFSTTSTIQDVSNKTALDYFFNDKHKFQFGTELIYHRYKPGLFKGIETIGNINKKDTVAGFSNNSKASEYAFFAEDEIKITPSLNGRIGIRWSAFGVEKKKYMGIEPRLGMSWHWNANNAIKCAYAKTQQYIHLLSSDGFGFPSDLWVASTAKIRPQSAQQIALGWSSYRTKIKIEIEIEGYYKQMKHLIDYKYGGNAEYNLRKDWQEAVEKEGTGKVYGMEFFLHKKEGRLTGLMGYTLSWNYRQFATINNGIKYPFRYDRRHDFEVTTAYQLSKRWLISGVWVYQTGAAVTVPIAEIETINGPSYIFGSKNNGRLAAFHRLDLGLIYEKTTLKGHKKQFNISIYNAYNRPNPYYLTVLNQITGQGINTRYHKVIKQVSLFTITPSVGYNYQF